MTKEKDTEVHVPHSVKKLSKTELMWEEVRDTKLDMWGLPDQTVEKHCTPVHGMVDKLMLKPRVSALIVFLETALGSNFDFETMDNGAILMSRRVKA